MIFRNLITTALLTLLSVAPALAGLEICNDSGAKRAVALAQKSVKGWQSQGWWIFKKGQCRTLVKGDLKQRYFYYRAVSDGQAIHTGKYSFCTDPGRFTIEGQGKCVERGHRKQVFERIDTGAKATHFTHRLRPPPPAKSADEALPEPDSDTASANTEPIRTRTFKPGTYGEPYTVRGVLQGCDTDENGSYCAYHAEGWKHFAHQGAGTDDVTLKELEKLGPGTMFEFVGDMISFGDITVQVAIATFNFVNDAPHSKLRETMQGFWNSTADSASTIIIEGAQKKDLYDANLAGEYYLQWQDTCKGSNGAGPVIIETNPENRESPQCFVIVTATEKSLILSLVGGNGQNLEFKRFD